MYENFKNDFVSNIAISQINLNENQIYKILSSMDKTAKKYNIYEKYPAGKFEYVNGMPGLVYDYLKVKELEGLSPNTIYSYKIMLEAFFRDTNKPLETIEAEDIRLFLCNYQNTSGVSNRTLDKYREYITRFFFWMYDMGYMERNPGAMVKPIHYEVKEREALSPYELEQLRSVCITVREKAIIEFLYSTACRVTEMTYIKYQDIDWRTNVVHIFGKGRKHRTSFLNARARLTLEEYLNTREGESEYIFISERKPYKPLGKNGIERIVRIINERLGINKNVTPHVLRHTTATNALHNGMPINEVSKLLGHSSVQTTMIYAKTMYDDLQISHSKYVM